MSEQIRSGESEKRKINPKIWGKLRKAVGEKEFANVKDADREDQIRYLSNFYPPEKIFLTQKDTAFSD